MEWILATIGLLSFIMLMGYFALEDVIKDFFKNRKFLKQEKMKYDAKIKLKELDLEIEKTKLENKLLDIDYTNLVRAKYPSEIENKLKS